MRWSFNPDMGEVTVDSRYAFRLSGPVMWNVPREGEGPELFCRAYGSGLVEQAYVGFVDVTADPDEPWTSQIKTPAHANEYDGRLHRDIEQLLSTDERHLVQWMRTHIQPKLAVHSILTAYIATDGAIGERQYADLRFEDCPSSEHSAQLAA